MDVFTKRQKENLFLVCYESPIVKPDKENTVPRRYIKTIHADLYQYMKTHFWGNPENQITYMELAIYGFSFLFNVSYMNNNNKFTPGTPQEEAARRIGEKFDRYEIYETAFKDVLQHIWFRTRSYSKVNFRFYGFKYNWENVPGSIDLKITIRITAQDSETKKFTINNVERKAFRILVPANGIYGSTEAFVWRKRIFNNAKDGDRLNIYIQSHVLHRIKERLDTFDPSVMNILIQFAFYEGLQVVKNGNQTLFSCMLQYNRPIGYFAFTVQGDDIVINTFIPLVSEFTPEGKKLHELLSISREEIIFLGMDKISFFAKVDFEQIPVLKQALIDSDIWQTKLGLDGIYDGRTASEKSNTLIDEQKTMFVKNFFDKHEIQLAELMES